MVNVGESSLEDMRGVGCVVMTHPGAGSSSSLSIAVVVPESLAAGEVVKLGSRWVGRGVAFELEVPLCSGGGGGVGSRVDGIDEDSGIIWDEECESDEDEVEREEREERARGG